jgi:hypothetical protein
VTACDIIRDFKTGDSLCYAFIGFDSDDACANAYFKMNNVSIDDRRIKARAACLPGAPGCAADLPAARSALMRSLLARCERLLGQPDV